MEKESPIGIIQEQGDWGINFDTLSEQDQEKLNIKKDNSKESK